MSHDARKYYFRPWELVPRLWQFGWRKAAIPLTSMRRFGNLDKSVEQPAYLVPRPVAGIEPLNRSVNAAELRTGLRRCHLGSELLRLAESGLSRPELIGRFLSN